MKLFADIEKQEYYLSGTKNDNEYTMKANYSIDLHSIDYKVPQIDEVLQNIEWYHSKCSNIFGVFL